MDSKIIHRDSDRKAVDVLYRISALSSSESNPLLSLGKILDEVIGVFGASSASLCMLNADSDKLLIEVEKGLSKESKGFELPMGVGITGWVAMHGEPYLSGDVANEEKYFLMTLQSIRLQRKSAISSYAVMVCEGPNVSDFLAALERLAIITGDVQSPAYAPV